MVDVRTINIDDIGAGKVSIKPENFKLGIVAAKFNTQIVDLLLEGALLEAEKRHIPSANIVLAKVPGAFELGFAARVMIEQQKPHAVVALGSVIRGETSHYDYVCAESARAIQDAAIDTGTAVIFGVLTTENSDQAKRRASPKQLNKGGQAVIAAVEMALLRDALA